MPYESLNFIYLSEIIDLPVVDAQSEQPLGHILDLAVAMGQVYPKTTGLITKLRGKRQPVYIPWSDVKKTTFKKAVPVEVRPGQENGNARENEILLKKTFLDKQIISTSGYKVVRVNDLQMLFDNTAKDNPNLWLVHIDIGVKGLLRRLGWLRFANAAFKWVVARDIRDKFVSWKHVQPTTTTNVYGSLHLKTDSSKLSEIHPADLADILEDLGIDERISLLESLDHLTAAATLQEMPLKLRVQIAETLEPHKFSGILTEMPMDETVDLLDELAPDKRAALFSLLPSEKVAEINELSKISSRLVGSIMNTDFITAKSVQTVQDVLSIVQEECKKAELLYYVYILDAEDRLRGIVTLRHLLSSEPLTVMADIMCENIVSVTIDTSIKNAAQLFFKYNFEAIPVLDEDGKIQGIVTFRDTLESVFPEVGEESKG
jgi:magnesium transporter